MSITKGILFSLGITIWHFIVIFIGSMLAHIIIYVHIWSIESGFFYIPLLLVIFLIIGGFLGNLVRALYYYILYGSIFSAIDKTTFYVHTKIFKLLNNVESFAKGYYLLSILSLTTLIILIYNIWSYPTTVSIQISYSIAIIVSHRIYFKTFNAMHHFRIGDIDFMQDFINQHRRHNDEDI